MWACSCRPGASSEFVAASGIKTSVLSVGQAVSNCNTVVFSPAGSYITRGEVRGPGREQCEHLVHRDGLFFLKAKKVNNIGQDNVIGNLDEDMKHLEPFDQDIEEDLQQVKAMQGDPGVEAQWVEQPALQPEMPQVVAVPLAPSEAVKALHAVSHLPHASWCNH